MVNMSDQLESSQPRLVTAAVSREEKREENERGKEGMGRPNPSPNSNAHYDGVTTNNHPFRYYISPGAFSVRNPFVNETNNSNDPHVHNADGSDEDDARGNVVSNAPYLVTDGTPMQPFEKKTWIKYVIVVALGFVIINVTLFLVITHQSESKRDPPNNQTMEKSQLSTSTPSHTPSSNPLVTSTPTPASLIDIVTDRFALTKIYEATIIDEAICWERSTNWLNENVHHCEWFGITCNPTTQRVNYLDLSQNRLCGTIASEIGLLHDLKWLSFHDNSMSGNLPSELFSVDMKNLETLYLLKNRFTGSIPSAIKNLKATLKELDIHDNFITGTIPSDIRFLAKLINLNLSETWIEGIIPSEIGLLSSLQYFFMTNINFAGAVLPSELGLLSSLKVFDVSGSALSSSVPSEIGLLQSLRSFFTVATNVHGQLPSEFGLLENLTNLAIALCSLSGSIPFQLGSSKNKLQVLQLSYNNITGEIPSELGLMRSLKHLDFRGNMISGIIPSELGEIHSMEFCRLNNCPNLTGYIPSTLCNLSSDYHLTELWADCALCESLCCTSCFR